MPYQRTFHTSFFVRCGKITQKSNESCAGRFFLRQRSSQSSHSKNSTFKFRQTAASKLLSKPFLSSLCSSIFPEGCLLNRTHCFGLERLSGQDGHELGQFCLASGCFAADVKEGSQRFILCLFSFGFAVWTCLGGGPGWIPGTSHLY